MTKIHKPVILNLSLVVFLLCFACNNDTSNNKDANDKLSFVGYKSITLDTETNYLRITPSLKVINGVEYIMFYNTNNRSIYIYNYETSELIHKIELAKEGPNQIKGSYIKGYYLHDLDTIFINARQHLYQINNKGTVVNKYQFPEREEDSGFYSALEADFDNSTYFNNDILYTNIEIPVPQKNMPNPIRAEINFKTSAIKKYIDIRTIFKDYSVIRDFEADIQKSGGNIGIGKKGVINNNRLYLSTPINDSVYVFNKDKLEEKYFVGDKDFPAMDYKAFYDTWNIKRDGDFFSIGRKPESGPYFNNFLINSETEDIYRILTQGREEVIEETSEDEAKQEEKNPLLSNFPKFKKLRITGASLIRFNLKSKANIVYRIPIDSVIPYSPLISKDNIHFKAKEQENEDQITYAIYKIEQ